MAALRRAPFVRRLHVEDKQRIIDLLRLGRSPRRVARETGHSRVTVTKYGREAGILRRPPGWKSEADVAGDTSRSSKSCCEPHRAFIEAALANGRHGVSIYQALVEHHGYTDSYDAVKRFIRPLRTTTPKISARFETLPGQEAQVDYGEGAPTRDARTGKYRKPRLFVMTLGASRHAFRKVVWNSSQEMWCRLHEEAFAYFGGVPETIRLDNLREGVLKPDIYDPQLNPLYAAMLRHYGVVALPCRPYAPDLKGKVESQIGYTQNALRGQRFEHIDAQNVFVTRWNERWAFTRTHGTLKRRVCDLFAEEQPALRPLPTTRFEYYRVVERRAHFDGYIEVDGAYYSVPLPCIGQTVIVHVGTTWLRVLDRSTHALLREHTIARAGGRRTCDHDRPPQTPPSTLAMQRRCDELGPAIGAFALTVLTQRGAEATRTLMGVLDLARRYEVASLESACTLAAQAHSTRLSLLRGYLQRHGHPVTMKKAHHVIPDFDRYIVHFNTAVTKGITV
jgi:transposase